MKTDEDWSKEFEMDDRNLPGGDGGLENIIFGISILAFVMIPGTAVAYFIVKHLLLF